MGAGDINQVTIAGHVEQPPRMSTDEDGQAVCEFLLSHASREHTEYGQWNLQHYAVAIYGQPARVFVDTYQPGEMIVIAGRLDSQEHSIPMWLWKRLGGARGMRPHDYARSTYRTWIIEPLARSSPTPSPPAAAARIATRPSPPRTARQLRARAYPRAPPHREPCPQAGPPRSPPAASVSPSSGPPSSSSSKSPATSPDALSSGSNPDGASTHEALHRAFARDAPARGPLRRPAPGSHGTLAPDERDVPREQIDIRKTTPAEPAAVWRLLADSFTWPSWTPIEWVIVDRHGDKHGLGEMRTIKIGRTRVREEIVERQVESALSYKLSSGRPLRHYHVDVDLTPTPEGTEIRWYTTVTSKVPGLGWLYRRELRKLTQEFVDGLAMHAATTTAPDQSAQLGPRRI